MNLKVFISKQILKPQKVYLYNLTFIPFILNKYGFFIHYAQVTDTTVDSVTHCIWKCNVLCVLSSLFSSLLFLLFCKYIIK